MDRTKVEKGMFLTSGPPASGVALTKVNAVRTVEELEAVDKKFDEAAKLQKILAETKRAIDLLKGGSK